MLEVDPTSFELVSAFAEGNVTIHLLDQGQDVGCQVLARSGIYYPDKQRVIVSGWEEIRYNGLVEKAPATMQQEAILPTDGSFLRPASAAGRSDKNHSPEPALAAA